MTRRRAVLAAALLPWPVRTQPRFPDRPLTLVVPFAAGGIADLVARAVAVPMARTLGQPIVIDNRPSAGSIVGTQMVAQARPDGHTLLLMSNANAVSVGLFRALPYDIVRDLAPIGTLGFFDLGLFVAASSRFTALADVLAYARAHPGRLNIGSIAVGSTQHLAAKLFESLAGVQALVVPYRGSPALLAALRGGEVDLAFEIIGPMLGQVAAGAVRPLAVSSGHRFAAWPGVPTVQQAGVAGYDVASWNALAVAAATPPAVTDILNRALRVAVDATSVREQLDRLGVRPQAGSAAELQALLASEIRRWGDVIRAAKIEPE